MKAIRVFETGAPDVLQLAELPDPQPREGQVVVKVHAIGVNPVETYIRSGKYGVLPSLPYTPGSDAAGVVEAVGSGVGRVVPGNRVYTAGTLSGAYAELTLCRENQIHRLPENVSFEKGAAVNIPYATAFRALFQRAAAVPGETVLIHGASGGVGVAATQIARAAGLQVIGSAGTERSRKMVLEQGAHQVVDHRAPDYLSKIIALTNGRGVEIILEMLANTNLGKDLTVLSHGGRVVIIGSRGTAEINPRDAMSRDAAVLGMVLFNTPEKEIVSIHAALGTGLENGTLRPVIGQRIPLAEAYRAHEAVMEPGDFGKIVLFS